MTTRVIVGDALTELRKLADASVHCCVTSPPYWGLRDYGTAQWEGGGSECDHLRPAAHGYSPFETWLRQDIIWHKPNPMPESVTDRCTKAHEYVFLLSKSERYHYDADAIRMPFSEETKAQSFDTMEFGLRDKYRGAGNVNPPKGQLAYEAGDEKQRTKAGLLAFAEKTRTRYKKPDGWDTGDGAHGTIHRDGREQGAQAPDDYVPPDGANKRSVWTIATAPYKDAHFATFPPALIEPCILAGCPIGGTVLDPFGGAGTTALVADRLQRNSILIELNPTYAAMGRNRVHDDAPLFAGSA